MSTELAKIELGDEGLKYMTEALGGWHALSDSLRPMLKGGRITACLPPGTTVEEAIRFEEGGKLVSSGEPSDAVSLVPNADQALVQIIQAYISRDSRNICIMENALADADDRHVRDLGNVFVSEGHVYHLVMGEASAESITATIREARMISEFVGALTRLPTEVSERLEHHMEISRSHLDQMAESAEAVFVGAYDGESFVLWEKW